MASVIWRNRKICFAMKKRAAPIKLDLKVKKPRDKDYFIYAGVTGLGAALTYFGQLEYIRREHKKEKE